MGSSPSKANAVTPEPISTTVTVHTTVYTSAADLKASEVKCWIDTYEILHISLAFISGILLTVLVFAIIYIIRRKCKRSHQNLQERVPSQTATEESAKDVQPQMSKMSVGSLDVSYIMMESVIGIFAVVGNALVMWAVKLNPALQKTTFFYIVSLALTDIAMGILVIPLAVLVSLGVIIHFYSCLFMCCLMMVFSHASILSLLAIAVDRYLRVKLPTRYRAAVTKKRICVVLGLCWLVSVLVGLVPMLGWNQHTGSSSYIECRYLAVMRMDYVVYFSFFAWIVLPLLIMCALYTEIFYSMRIKLSPSSANPPEGGRVCGKEYKMAKYLALILFLFAVSWLPLGILNCISYFCPSCAIPQPLMYLGILLSHANSAMNPVIYAFKIQKFKETYTFILRTYILLQKSESITSRAEHTAELGASTI